MTDKMEEPERKTPSLKSQSAWLMFAKTIGFGLSFLLPLIIYRRLNQSEAGIYKQVFLVITNATSILPLGVSMSAYYFLSRESHRRPFYITNILLFNFMVGGLAALTLFLFPQILGNLFQDQEMTDLASGIGIVIWINIFSVFLEIVVIANQEPRLATVFIILSQLTKTLMLVSVVAVFGTVNAMLYAFAAYCSIQSIILLIYLKSRFVNFWHSFDRQLFASHLKYAIPFGLASILYSLQFDGHNFFVGHQFTPAQVAVYSVGCFELPLLAMLYESITSVLIPRMSHLQLLDDKREIIELTARATEKLAIIYLPTYVYFFIVAEDFIITLFTESYRASIPIFLVNITLLPFYILISDPIVRAFKQLGRFILILRIIIVTCLFTTFWYGISYFGLVGTITIVVATAIVERLISAYIAWRIIGVKLKDIVLLKNVGKIALASLFAGIITFFFHWKFRDFVSLTINSLSENLFYSFNESAMRFLTGVIILAGSGITLALVFVFTANYLGAISYDEKKLLKNVFRRFTPSFKTN